MEKVILHHLGLGDHIICNGLVRTLLQKENLILHYPVKFHNYENVDRMFADCSEIKLVPVSSDQQMLEYSNGFNEDQKIKLGVFSSDWKKQKGSFCEKFYNQATVSYENRWKKFVVPSTNSNIMKHYSQEKCFVHHDPSRGLNIKSKYLTASCYFPNHKLGDINLYNIFDYLEILKCVNEIHCIDSSFACMIDHIPELRSKRKFIHRYVRKQNENPIYKNNWSILYE